MYPSCLPQLSRLQTSIFVDQNESLADEFQMFFNNLARTSSAHNRPNEIHLFHYAFRMITYNDKHALPSSITDLLVCATCYQKAADAFPVPTLKQEYYSSACHLLDRVINNIDASSDIVQTYKSLYGYAFNLRGSLNFKYNSQSIQQVIDDFKRASELEYTWASANLAFVYEWMSEIPNNPSYTIQHLKKAFTENQKALEANGIKSESFFAEIILNNQESILKKVLRIEGTHRSLEQFLLKLVNSHHPSAKIVLAESYYKGFFCDTPAEYYCNLSKTVNLLTEITRGQNLANFPFLSFQQVISAQKLLDEIACNKTQKPFELKSDLRRALLSFKLRFLFIKYGNAFKLLNESVHNSNSLKEALFELTELNRQLKNFDVEIKKEYFQQLIEDAEIIPVIRNFCRDHLQKINLKQIKENILQEAANQELQKILGSK